uniref:Uncharacterized protein n=1 Tax=Nelumbo nucifera TaxID=4432 RepID=A0A822YAZ5_NELNU|nr:TPA_asm: hypothetical protein HUJ06_029927 [Nelumbo nucifera]
MEALEPSLQHPTLKNPATDGSTRTTGRDKVRVERETKARKTMKREKKAEKRGEWEEKVVQRQMEEGKDREGERDGETWKWFDRIEIL